MTATTESKFLFGIPRVELPTYKSKPSVGSAPVPPSNGINYELLDEIMNFIEAHPRTWVQDSWYKNVDPETGVSFLQQITEEVEETNSCSTSFCFAGHVALHEGFPNPPKTNVENWTRLVVSEDGTYSEDVSDFARDILGLTYDQAEALFGSSNSMEDLKLMVQVLHEFPTVKGWRMDDLREYQYTMDEVRVEIQNKPGRWLTDAGDDED